MLGRFTALAAAALATGCLPPLDRPLGGRDLAPAADEGSSGASDLAIVREAPGLDASRREAAATREAGPPEAGAPDAELGRWYQVDRDHCPTYCAGLGRTNVDSPDSARCMSGEVRPKSGVDQGIKFKYGCPSGCSAQAGPLNAASVDDECYRAGQKQDHDDSDRTVGCFCR